MPDRAPHWEILAKSSWPEDKVQTRCRPKFHQRSPYLKVGPAMAKPLQSLRKASSQNWVLGPEVKGSSQVSKADKNSTFKP